MRLLGMTALVMVLFAGNSLLTRAGLTAGGMEVLAFSVVRLVAGAVVLAGLCTVSAGGLRFGGPGRWRGVGALLLYIFGFSAAYTGLDAGIGALILFGMVQITMFAAAVRAGEPLPARRWTGAGLAFAGLVWLMWPGGAAVVSAWHGAAMALAGIGWGLYSLAGQREPDALMATAANFVIASGVGLGLALLATGGALAGDVAGASGLGLALAVASGALTSGLGYALWYSVVPQLDKAVAATAQLTVPVIAMAGGMIWLGEALSLRFVLASVLVLGGVALTLRPQRGKRRSSGS